MGTSRALMGRYLRRNVGGIVLLAVLSALLAACTEDAKHPPVSDGGHSDAATPDAGKTTKCTQDADCDDGLFCNGTESCVGNVCQAGKSVTCDDGIACTVDKCSERTHKCESNPPDGDGDGHYDSRCKDKAGKILGDDCDDTDPLRFPGNIETCDPDNKDDDCDPKTFGEKDSDDDGYFDHLCCNAVSDAKGAKLVCGDDCDDLKPSVHPKATEVCDLYDNDCDGNSDEGVAVKQYPDTDFDGHGAEKSAANTKKHKSTSAVMKCAGTVGYAPDSNDCDDGDPEVFEGQFEICDGKDNNCKDGIDEIEQEAPWFVDADGDLFGDATGVPVYSCERIPGRVLSHNDCNDQVAAIKPSAAELCDGIDNDCSGKRDFKLGTNDFEDDDNDGVADFKCTGGTDCDDRDPTTGKGMEEVCDMHDNDCDGMTDEETAQTVWYLDRDGDGWGTDQGTALARCEPIPGRAASLGDCDDEVNSTHPGALETCNGDDDNCNGKADEGADFQCQVANAVSFCKLGSCAVLSCFPGFDDCDKNPANGCECKVPIAPLPTQPQFGCSTDIDCDDHNYCNGKEHCHTDDFLCYAGTPVNCSASDTVLQGSFSISSSLDIQMLSGIETITGDLHIFGQGLVNLTGLESLKTIGGNLVVDGDPNDDQSLLGNQALEALVGSGLYNLINVGGTILIEDNPALKVIRLPSLVQAQSIIIRRNAALATLDGFDALARIESELTVVENPLLTKLSGMQGLSICGRLEIHDNAMTDLRLPGLKTLHGDLYLSPNYRQAGSSDTLVKVVLTGLTKVEGAVNVYGMPLLATLSLPALKSVGTYLTIGSCPKIDDPDLHSLAKLGGSGYAGEGGPSFQLYSNDSLTTVDRIGAVDCAVPGDCYGSFDNNPLLPNCSAHAVLDTFTNFGSRWLGYNLASDPDASMICQPGYL